jgi:adenylosuccinate lyase
VSDKINFNTYQSPFTWRYGTDEMREIFSEVNKRKIWRKLWVQLASEQQKAGLLTKEELDDIKKNADIIDIAKSHEIEKEIYHDLMAEVKFFAGNAKKGGGKIHLGATSMDIEDNADSLIVNEAFTVIEKKVINLLSTFCQKIEKYQGLVCMGYTHLQPAEPTTLGYRFSLYAYDLLLDLRLLRQIRKIIVTKGFKGAVGTSASYEKLLKGKNINADELSGKIMQELGLSEATVASQTYPRKIDFLVSTVLASIAQSLSKFCFDLRIMQSPNFGEWSESRDTKRVGSSAMPFKRNPDKAEKVCSLGRLVAAIPNILWENAANSLLERTLDDSANKRVVMPQAFLATDEMLTVSTNLIKDLVISQENIAGNLKKYGPFAGTESLMMEAVNRGGNRQELHERIREIAMVAWEQMGQGKPNPLVNLLKNDKMITSYVDPDSIEEQIDPASHVGLAQKNCGKLIKEIHKEVSNV